MMGGWRWRIIHARQRQLDEVLDVVLVEIGASIGDLGQDRSVFQLELGQQAFRVRFLGEEILDSLDGDNPIADPLVEAIAERVSRIGRDKEYLLVWILFGEVQGAGDGRSSFSNASLTAEKNKPLFVFQETRPHVCHIQTPHRTLQATETDAHDEVYVTAGFVYRAPRSESPDCRGCR